MEIKKIVKFNIDWSKENIKKSLLKDAIIIFFTRVIEDLSKYKNPNFYGRIKELFLLLYPYSNIIDTKNIYQEIKNSDLKSKEGLPLDKEEIDCVRFFIDNLNTDCKLKESTKIKSELNKILIRLVKKYLPNSSSLIEPYLLGKLIASIGGVKNLYRKPASTIQLIGAEKALFRHISRGKSSPKYGLIFYSSRVQESNNLGKSARQLANRLAISIKVDYFKNFAQ